MADGHFARHLRRMRDVYAERHAALIEGAHRWLGGRIEVRAVNAGLQTVGMLPRGMDGAELARRAAARDVETVSIRRYARTPLEQDGLQLGFGGTAGGNRPRPAGPGPTHAGIASWPARPRRGIHGNAEQQLHWSG